jgi:hypothetical protein
VDAPVCPMNISCRGVDRWSRWGLLLCSLASILGCNDLRWTQKSSAYAPDVGFENCIKAGIEEVPNLSITRFEYDRYFLSVRFQKPLPGVRAFVQKRDAQVADIVFVGTSWHESDEERSEITPILNELTDAIKRYCVASKAAPST